MLTNLLGKTGLCVSRIGFGGMRFRDQKNVEECAALVKRAYDLGINYFDTAPGYGDSEKLFGEAFREMRKTRAERPFVVSTKTTQSEPDAIRADLECSLERMGLDAIDVYHMWCLMSLDKFEQRRAAGALEAFERLRDEGLVRHIAVSTHMPGQDVGALLQAYPFESVLLGYSAMNFPYREAGVAAAAELGRGVIAMNPLGGGIIPRNPERFDFLKSDTEQGSVVEGALRFLFDDSRIGVVLVGFADHHDLETAVAAANAYAPSGSAMRERIRERLREAFNALCTGCGYCDDCPQGIPIPKLMDAYNQMELSGGKDAKAVVQRLRYHWGIAPDDPCLGACTRCGRCEPLCTQNLPITDRIRLLSEIVADVSAKDG